MHSKVPLSVADLHDRPAVPLWHTLCGKRLLQMRIGHAQMLEAMNLWGAFEPSEVLLAAFICSRTPEVAQEQFDSTTLRFRLALWSLRLGRRWDWNVSREIWKRYVRYHMSEPFSAEHPDITKLRRGDNSSRVPVNTPWLTHLRVVLCAKCGYRPETFHEQPIGQAILDYYTVLEMERTVVLATVTREEMLERRATQRQEPKP